MNIAIIGYRGTGKTTVSKKVAEALGMGYISTDKMIMKKSNMSIKELVEKSGWKRFRDLEEESVRQIQGHDNYVIDCGGGIIERAINIRRLKKSCKIILLTADLKTILDRIKDCGGRPSLTNGKSFTEEISMVLRTREEKYKNAADIVIDTTSLMISQVVEKIKGALNGI